MGDASKLAKAQLIELDSQFKNPESGGKSVTVQFNPETLKVTFANRTQEKASAGDQRGNSPRQVVGAGATKLALQLWFDVNAPGQKDAEDVRELTRDVAYFMLPKPGTGPGSKNTPSPPGVRFHWGTFQFDGMMDALEETLDFFSPDGKPLRASLSLGFSGQIEIVSTGGGAPGQAAAARPSPGTQPVPQAPAGSSVQGLAQDAGLGDNWQGVAAANGIENPRLLEPGQLVDINAGVGVGLSAGAGFSAGLEVGLSAGAGFSAGIGVDVVGGVTGGISVNGGVGIGAGASLSAGLNVPGISGSAGFSAQAGGTGGGFGVGVGIQSRAGLQAGGPGGFFASPALQARRRVRQPRIVTSMSGIGL